MLAVALEREVDGDLLLSDLGEGLPLRPHSFDGAVSISAVQWLCNADKTGAEPRLRLKARLRQHAARVCPLTSWAGFLQHPLPMPVQGRTRSAAALSQRA